MCLKKNVAIFIGDFLREMRISVIFVSHCGSSNYMWGVRG